jgi:uncharacterized protein YceK
MSEPGVTSLVGPESFQRIVDAERGYVPPPVRIYRAIAIAGRKVICSVHCGDRPSYELEDVSYHAQRGFDFGPGCSANGCLDLALSILLDHLMVPVVYARNVYRCNFRTSDVRLLYVWMSHRRLVEQRLSGVGGLVEVDEWELDRLLRRRFLTQALEEVFDAEVRERERVQGDGRRRRAGEHKKPGNEVEG